MTVAVVVFIVIVLIVAVVTSAASLTQCDFQSDIWALGCLLHELASGCPQTLQLARKTPLMLRVVLFFSYAVHCRAGRPPYISANFKTLLDEIMHAPPPQLPKYIMLRVSSPGRFVTRDRCSAAFNDLLSRCLAKDPASRITLSEVVQHPFWDVKFPALSLPDQPAASSGHTVDVMRLSRAMVC